MRFFSQKNMYQIVIKLAIGIFLNWFDITIWNNIAYKLLYSKKSAANSKNVLLKFNCWHIAGSVQYKVLYNCLLFTINQHAIHKCYWLYWEKSADNSSIPFIWKVDINVYIRSYTHITLLTQHVIRN